MPVLTSRINPFPGLRPFSRNEGRFYVGRELDLQQVVPRIRALPLTVMFARSGMGKSSFLACRVIPDVEETSCILCVDEWNVDAPHELVAESVGTLIGYSDELGKKVEKPVLVLDQFEDVFKSATDRHNLWDYLASVVNVSAPLVHILISMREEWLGAWVEAEEYLPAAFESMVRLKPLTEADSKRAITEPPRVEGRVTVAADVTEEIVKDLRRGSVYGVTDPYVDLGRLQLVCRRLWEIAADETTLERRTIGVELYNKKGRSDGIVQETVVSALGRVDGAESVFSSGDRVFWFGMVRHMVAARGVKAIVTAETLAKEMRIGDLGFAGRAIVRACLSAADEEYLEHVPERREPPSEALVGQVQGVLEKGVECGFLKRHTRRVGTGKREVFELIHDSLGEILREASIDFEIWLRRQYSGALLIRAVILCASPVLVLYAMVYDNQEHVDLLVASVLLACLCVAVAAVMVSVAKTAWETVKFRIVRRCARGIFGFRARPRRNLRSRRWPPFKTY